MPEPVHEGCKGNACEREENGERQGRERGAKEGGRTRGTPAIIKIATAMLAVRRLKDTGTVPVSMHT